MSRTLTDRLLAWNVAIFAFGVPAIGHATDVSDEFVLSMKTPYGAVKVIRSEDTNSLDTVTIDGKPVLKECCHVGLYKRFKLPEGIAVLAGVNQLGSSTPYNDDYYIILKPDAAPSVVTAIAFIALYDCKWKTASCTAKSK